MLLDIQKYIITDAFTTLGCQSGGLVFRWEIHSRKSNLNNLSNFLFRLPPLLILFTEVPTVTVSIGPIYFFIAIYIFAHYLC